MQLLAKFQTILQRRFRAILKFRKCVKPLKAKAYDFRPGFLEEKGKRWFAMRDWRYLESVFSFLVLNLIFL